MNTLPWEAIGVVTGLVIAAGTAIASFVTLSYRMGKAAQRLQEVEETVKLDVKPELKALHASVDRLSTRIDTLSKRIDTRIDSLITNLKITKVSVSKSPRQLNEYGTKILEDSIIGKLVEDRTDEILQAVKKHKPQNPYQVEQHVMETVRSFKDKPELRSDLEDAAYQTGSSIDEVLAVGGLYIRDTILERLGMLSKATDGTHKPKPSSKQ